MNTLNPKKRVKKLLTVTRNSLKRTQQMKIEAFETLM